MLKKIFLVVVASLCSLSAFDLVTPQRQAVIVVPDSALPTTLLAAQELVEYVEKSTGKRLQIVPEGQAGKASGATLRIGTLDTLKTLPPQAKKALDDSKRDEAFYTYVKGDVAYIVGKSKTAELYGAYSFLRKEVGVRWLRPAMPGDSGEFVPAKAELKLADCGVKDEPWFTVRRLDPTGVFWNKVPYESQKWAVRNGYQIRTLYGIDLERYSAKDQEFFQQRMNNTLVKGGHNSFSAAIPLKKYAQSNPEYFSLIDGKRNTTPDRHGIAQYCLSNPEVQRLLAEFVCKRIEEKGVKNTGYLFGMQDTSVGWCECDECRKLDQTEKYNYLDISTRFHTVVNKIAQQIYARYPEAQLYAWAYHTYRKIPKGLVHDKRMTTQYCIHGRCYGHKLDDPSCARNVEQFGLLKKWVAISSAVNTYEYFSCTPPLYTPHELTQAYDLRLYKKLGITGWKEEAMMYDSTPVAKDPKAVQRFKDCYPSCWQWLYVTAQLLWNPDADEKAVIADAESCYYGKAYPAMKKYHDLRRKIWDNSRNCMGYPTGDQRTPFLLNYPDSKQNLLKYLAEAEKLSAGDAQLQKRISDDKRWLEAYWIKPNDEQREKLGKEFRAPKVAGKVVIDGDGSDPAWVGACYTEEFKNTNNPAHPPIPAELKTRVGILSDAENLYFLVTAMEPSPEKLRVRTTEKDGPVWGDDGMEFFIYPPTADNSYYHLIVNTKGVVYDSVNPGAKSDFNLGATVAVKVLKDRYVMEVKVPVKKLGNFARGEVWKIHFCRSVHTSDKGPHFSIDGTGYHDYANYRALEIGSPFIKNGSFDNVKDGKPVGWSLNKFASLVKKGDGAYSIALQQNGNIMQLLTDRELWQKPQPRRVQVTFRATGNGLLRVAFYNYSDTPDRKAKHGYRRKFLPSTIVGEFKLDGKPAILQCEYTIPANQWAGLALSMAKGTAEVDDVSVTMLGK